MTPSNLKNDRRNFIINTSLVSLGLILSRPMIGLGTTNTFVSQRPELSKRRFVSKSVEKKIIEIKSKIKDQELAWLFENCYPNTLDTTVFYSVQNGKNDTFIITGDINAMWLRDSTAQVWPYLPLVNEDIELKKMIQGLINRQTNCVLIDPYANAHNISKDVEDKGWQSDDTQMKPELHERKWELDSLCYLIRLAYHYWKTCNDASIFDEHWVKAMKLIVKTFKEQQRKEGNGPYYFRRNGTNPTDTAGFDGYGNKVNPVGLIASLFRPSDDGTIFPFLIPSNLFAIVSLRQLAEIFKAINQDENFQNECLTLAKEIEFAVNKYGTVIHPEFGKIFAYEVDGYGSLLLMDDANIPSLLSLPYLNCIERDNEIYINTRKFSLSEKNPWFFKGTKAEGVGGPHTGRDTIWPMGIIMRAMTSNNEDEILACLKMLKATHANTGFMHESFHKNNPEKFSRKWFAWANTLLGELIIKLAEGKPELLNLSSKN